jgi:hypothetical protein
MNSRKDRKKEFRMETNRMNTHSMNPTRLKIQVALLTTGQTVEVGAATTAKQAIKH